MFPYISLRVHEREYNQFWLKSIYNFSSIILSEFVCIIFVPIIIEIKKTIII